MVSPPVGWAGLVLFLSTRPDSFASLGRSVHSFWRNICISRHSFSAIRSFKMRSHVRGLLGLAGLASVNAAAVKDTVTADSIVFNHQQCWTKGTSFDALSDDAFASNSMTLEKCADFCSDYKYLGVANGKECKLDTEGWG